MLQPSPFPPDQFISHSDNQAFIKKRPVVLTEDLVEGRLEFRLRRPNTPKSPRRSSDPSHFDILYLNPQSDPSTPPNPPKSPVSFTPCDMSLSRDRHPPSSRRKSNARRSPKITYRSSCTGVPSPRRKPLSREPIPIAYAAPRLPLTCWSPPAVSAMHIFPTEVPTLPTTPPCPSRLLPPHCRVPWTVTSPSTSPYPDHSPIPNSQNSA